LSRGKSGYGSGAVRQLYCLQPALIDAVVQCLYDGSS